MWKDQFLHYLKESTIKEPRLDEAIALKHSNLPKRIYKYCSDNDYARENLTFFFKQKTAYEMPK